MARRFLPGDRRVRVRSVEGVAAPTPPSRLWVTWPWEPFLTLGGSTVLLAALVLATTPLPLVETAAVVLVGMLGLGGAALGVVVSAVRRRREALGFRHASTVLLSQRYR